MNTNYEDDICDDYIALLSNEGVGIEDYFTLVAAAQMLCSEKVSAVVGSAVKVGNHYVLPRN